MKLGKVEPNALEELARDRIGVLIGVEYVRPMPIQDLRERSDEAFSIGTADEKCCGLFHYPVLSPCAGVRPAPAQLAAQPLHGVAEDVDELDDPGEGA